MKTSHLFEITIMPDLKPRLANLRIEPTGPRSATPVIGSRFAPGFVIAEVSLGVFVGQCLGLTFWSSVDAAGEDRAVTFDSLEEAERMVSILHHHDRKRCNGPRAYTIAGVLSGFPADLERAGLDAGDLHVPHRIARLDAA